MKTPWLRFCLLAPVAALAIGLLGGCATQRTAASKRLSGAPAEAAPHSVRTEERPGLGTEWGPTRVSWVETTTFPRARSRPDARSFVYYNDRDGVNAMLDYLGGNAREADGLRPAGEVSYGLRDGDGRWLKAWELKGQRFVAGERGRRYEVILKNDSARRVEVVLSVDGLDALDGDAARVDKRGYILDPREELAVEGFRTSDGTVAAFCFGAMGDTYAQKRHGNNLNCGVVGVAIFREGRGETPAGQPMPRRRAKPGEMPSSREYAKPPEA
jgi:hypothetical protein